MRSRTNSELLLLQQLVLYVGKREEAMATNATSGEEAIVAKEESSNADAQEKKGCFFKHEFLGHLSQLLYFLLWVGLMRRAFI